MHDTRTERVLQCACRVSHVYRALTPLAQAWHGNGEPAFISFLATANSYWLTPANLASYRSSHIIRISSMPSTLSEKAKGKQRATEPEQPESEAPPSKDLTIRFTEGIPDLTVPVVEKDTVKEVKDNVSIAASPPSNVALTVLLYSIDPFSTATTCRQAAQAHPPGTTSSGCRTLVFPDSVRAGTSEKAHSGIAILAGGWASGWR